MKKIGIIVAMADEMFPFIESKGDCQRLTVGARTVYVLKSGEESLYMTQSGVGEIAAASAAQFLIDRYEVEILFNFGLAGALTDGFSAGETCIVESVVHYDFDTSLFDDIEPARYADMDSIYMPTTPAYTELISKSLGLRRVKVASGDKFVDGSMRKDLFDSFKTQLCEMESAAIVRVAFMNGIDTVIAKTISDSEELSYAETKELACGKFATIVDELLNVIIK